MIGVVLAAVYVVQQGRVYVHANEKRLAMMEATEILEANLSLEKHRVNLHLQQDK